MKKWISYYLVIMILLGAALFPKNDYPPVHVEKNMVSCHEMANPQTSQADGVMECCDIRHCDACFTCNNFTTLPFFNYQHSIVPSRMAINLPLPYKYFGLNFAIIHPPRKIIT